MMLISNCLKTQEGHLSHYLYFSEITCCSSSRLRQPTLFGIIGKGIENKTRCYFAAVLNFSGPTSDVVHRALCVSGRKVVKLEDN